MSMGICCFSLLMVISERLPSLNFTKWPLCYSPPCFSLLPPPTPLLRSPRVKPRDRPQSPKYGGHDGPWLSDPPGRSRCLCTRLLLQLRTGAVSRADLPPGRTEDLLPRLCIGKGKCKPWMLPQKQMLGGGQNTAG